jgi:soluble lytic murein transglycosylase
MMVRLIILSALGVFLLCQCATKHQPIRFTATFQTYPDNLFSSSTVKECRLLESKEELSLLEKKRLTDLYMLEAKHLKPGSERLQEVLEKAEKLRGEVESLVSESETIKLELFSERKDSMEEEKISFQNSALKKSFSQVYQLWNKDENEQAWSRVKDLVSNQELAKASSRAEWMRVLNLQFRISHDIGDLSAVVAAYQQIKDFDNCSAEAANAALLTSLTYFSKKNPAKAVETLKEQCDKDQSLSNKARKTYWTYRFQKSIDPKLAEATFQELSSLALPGYYLYLAKSDKGENFQIPATDEKASSSYLEETFEVPSSANKYLNQAEDRLKAGLNKDAALYLNKAVNIVKDNPEKNLLSLLYIAHLYRAAGNHLESMKTFSLLIGGNKNLKPEWTPVLHSEFLEMFPRPFNDKVSWLAREWNIDQDFIYAIMRQESAFNPGAVSATDARGLMQLMPSLARSLSQSWKYQPYSTDKVLFQADENLKLSTYHLYQLQKLAPHYALMAASYNAGLKRTSRWWQKFGGEPLDVFVEFIPVNETRNYVKLVLRNFLYYKALRSGGSLPPNVFAMNLPPYSMPRAVSSIKKRK